MKADVATNEAGVPTRWCGPAHKAIDKPLPEIRVYYEGFTGTIRKISTTVTYLRVRMKYWAHPFTIQKSQTNTYIVQLDFA